MHLLFVKLHLIIFEVVSLGLFIAVFFALFYYSIIKKNRAAMKDEKNIESLDIYFSAEFSKDISADVKIKLYEKTEANKKNGTEKGTILYCKPFFEDYKENKEEIIKAINEDDPSNIFIFESEDISSNFKHRLLNLKSEASTFNLTLFTLISLFLIFMKITLLKDSIYRLKKIKSSKSDGKNEIYTNLLAQIHPEEYALSSGKEEPKNLYYNPVLSFLNPINVYYYIIFNLTIVIIIPLIFPNYIEYSITSYIGFMKNMYNSVYYGRSLFGDDDILKSDNVTLENLKVREQTPKNLFMVHNPLNLTDYVPTNINPYMINLLIMCGSIWLSQLFHPFNTQGTVKIADVDLKKGKLKKYMKIASIVAVFTIWGCFIIYGLIYELDLFYLYHRLLFNNFRKIFDFKIPIFIGFFYYYIYFYVIMAIYTYQTYTKNKKYEGNQQIVYNWFS
jgi:hypothetical protein